jgi:long-subunit fatty acid transport protein
VDDEDILTTTSSFDTTRTSSSSFNLPLAAGLGFSYTFSNRYLLAGDVSSQFWSSTNLTPVGTSEFRNSSRYSLGMEIMPERDIDNYFRRVAYRIGVSYHSTYISVNGRPINEFYFTGGMGFPMGFDARLNVGLHVGFRGINSDGLQKDMMYRLTFSVSASEAWFLKIEED